MNTSREYNSAFLILTVQHTICNPELNLACICDAT